ncbi:hypothetical protein [Vibrio tubiashii]|uniref:hypothetical protein n=1 Tax=Vibrio tubiashii TaxID=29498 RepID=UPI00349E68AD
MKKFTIVSALAALTSACSLHTPHIGEVVEGGTNPYTGVSTEYSILATDYDVTVVASFSEYQGMRDSKAGFKGCTRVMNDAAKAYADNTGKRIKPINWQTMKEDGYLDHGRDILSAIMNVNCKYTYEYL